MIPQYNENRNLALSYAIAIANKTGDTASILTNAALYLAFLEGTAA